MKNDIEYLKKLSFYDNLNEIADYVLLKTGVDVRENTKSRKDRIADYRSLFFVMAIDNLKITYGLLAAFLDKDHATINHSVKRWNNLLHKELGVYTVGFKPSFRIKVNPSFDRRIDPVFLSNYSLNPDSEENEISLLKEEVASLKRQLSRDNHLSSIKIQRINRNIKNDCVKQLLTKSEDVINEFAETRLKPFLKMLDNRVTYEDVLSKRPESIYN